MVNLFAEQGVQPETLQASLVLAQKSTDFTAPLATITTDTTVDFQAGQISTITGTAVDLAGGLWPVWKSRPMAAILGIQP